MKIQLTLVYGLAAYIIWSSTFAGSAGEVLSALH